VDEKLPDVALCPEHRRARSATGVDEQSDRSTRGAWLRKHSTTHRWGT